MKSSMFQRAYFKLTSLYLVIIMSISLIFSLGLYQMASREIEQGIRRPNSFAHIIRLNDLEGLQDFIAGQENAVQEGKQNIRYSLYVINLFIFITGGMLSYFLARRSLRPIEQAHEAQSRFTSDASHELRTPIAAMRLENEIALTDPKLTLKEARKQLESNIEELDKLTSLSEGLLQLSRLENIDIPMEEIDIKKVIEHAIKRNNREIRKKKQTLVWAKKSVKIVGNEEALINAVATLLNNSSKYSPDKSEIKISTKVEKQDLKISVADHGIGIAPLDIDRIFDRFYRADSSRTKNETDGYGIGLSIAKKSIDAHNGKISVKSTVGKGSTLTIILPIN